MIQILTYSGKGKGYSEDDIVLNSIHDACSLDEFDINVISLADEKMWKNNSNKIDGVNNINDLYSLSKMIKNSCKTKIVILIPQNAQYRYSYDRYSNCEDKLNESCELKNMIKQMIDYVLTKLYACCANISLCYENTRTRIGNEYINAAFYFEDVNVNDILLTTDKSNKITAIKCENVILSTLNLKTGEQVTNFLKEVKLIQDKQNIPKWMEEIKMFDDIQQLMKIEENTQAIKVANDNISDAMKKINKNNEYKSILYTNSEELVKVVFEILENMLGCDLSQFEDKKKEDFSFEMNGVVYIGEIKGISSNVKSQNISQLEYHYQGFIDEHPEIDYENVKQILIINHQRNIPLLERDPIDRKQIELALRYGSLIVETKILLRLFEKYLAGDISQGECLELLKTNTGLLEI